MRDPGKRGIPSRMIISVAAVSNSDLDLQMPSSFKFLVADYHGLKAIWSGTAQDDSVNTSCRRETAYHTILLPAPETTTEQRIARLVLISRFA